MQAMVKLNKTKEDLFISGITQLQFAKHSTVLIHIISSTLDPHHNQTIRLSLTPKTTATQYSLEEDSQTSFPVTSSLLVAADIIDAMHASCRSE